MERIELSENQVALLRLLAEGKSLKIIAHEYDTTVSCIGGRLASIYRKMGVKNGPQAISEAYKQAIIPVVMPPHLRGPQWTVLKGYLANDLSYRKTGFALDMSRQAVHQCLTRMCEALGDANPKALVERARNEGWLK